MTATKFAKILRTLADALRDRQVKATLMGGAALPVHGVERMTLDLDFLLDEQELPVFAAVAAALGYQQVLRTPQFAKFRHPDPDAMDLDTVFVDPGTAAQAWLDATDQPLGDAVFRCASLSTMLATKLHAIRHNETRRGIRDLDDLLGLISANAIDPAGPEFSTLCHRYGTAAIHRRILDALGLE